MASIQQVTVPLAAPTSGPTATAVEYYDHRTGTWLPMSGLNSLADAAAQGFISLGNGIFWKYTSFGGGGAGAGALWINLRETTSPGGAISNFGAPMASSPNLEPNFDAWGSPIPLMMGHVRLMGKITFAQGLEVGASAAALAFIDIEVSFGYPLDPNEYQWIECVGVWANGNKIFGGAADLPGLSFTFYEGQEDSPVDPLVLADKGASRATGSRGMRRIVFKQFPIGILGGGLPMFSAEFSMTKDAPAPLISVAEVIKKIHARGGITLSTESNFDDEAVGVVFMSDVAPVALARDLMPTYNYFIKDGDGASLSRREVNNDLEIDGDPLDVNDMIVESNNESPITFERAEQSEISNIIAIQYTDVDLAFTNGVQYARRPIFPIREALSDARGNIQLPFVIDAVTALLLNYDQLYRGWTEQQKIKFKSSDIRIEVGDVKAINGQELGNYVVRVAKSTLRFDTSVCNEIEAVVLLKSTGVDANADSGDYITDTIISALNYPDIIYFAFGVTAKWGQILVSGGAILTLGVGSASDIDGGFNRKIALVAASTSIPSHVSHGALTFSTFTTPYASHGGQIVEDSQYIYVADFGRSGIQRINKADTDDTDYLDLTGSTPSLAVNGNQFAIKDGFMYWGARASGAALKVFRLDLSLFSVAGLTSLSLDGDTTTFSSIGVQAVGDSLFVTTFDRSANDSRLYEIELTDPTFTSFSYTSLTDGPAAGQGYLGRGVNDGNAAYFLPLEDNDSGGTWDDEGTTKSQQIYAAKIEPGVTGSPTVTWFDLTDDASVTFASKGNRFPWKDSENLYFLANNKHATPYTEFLAARKLSDLSVVTGFDLTTIYDTAVFDFFNGASDGTFHFITGRNVNDALGAMIKVEQDLSAGVLFYRGVSGAPDNDDFADAAPLTINTSVTADNILATKEAGEPNHNGDTSSKTSIWYRYTAETSGTKTIDATATPAILLSMGVYTGSAVDALTPVASGSSFFTFSATAGVTYRIAISGFFGATGIIKFDFTG